MHELSPNAHLRQYLEHLTSEPGVYRMRDVDGQVLYVGKAGNLKKRVSSYFSQHTQGAKTRALVRQIASIDVSITRSETEALLLESSLIKTLQPKYNVLMRDDKSYPYLRLTLSHPFPSIEMVRCKKKPKTNDYFGPYPGVVAVRETLSLIQTVFNIRNCTDSTFSARSRPCLQYQLQRCSAPCTGLIAKEAYQQAVNDATCFLQGKSQQIIEEFEARMASAVQRLAFEEAAVLRYQIKHMRIVQEQQGVVLLQGDADVVVVLAHPGFACVQWVTVRAGQVLDSQAFFPTVPNEDLGIDALWQQVFEAFITHYYQDRPERIPAVIVTDHPDHNQQALMDLLSGWRGSPCRIHNRPRGVNARWLDFARNNLNMVSSNQHIAVDLMKKRYEALRELLQQNTPLSGMICFDISHTQGKETVASCVVFDAQGPCKRAYRRFNIEGITPGDDYAAIEQAVSRHFKRLKQTHDFPSLVVIDGGKGQVASARKALDALGIEGVKLLGIAKGPSRKAGFERLFLVDGVREISLPPDDLALHLLQHIRDEAHRFAITAHRKRRENRGLDSSLSSIPGVGSARRHGLLQRFGGLRALAKASIEEIAKVHGISNALAIKIYEHFH